MIWFIIFANTETVNIFIINSLYFVYRDKNFICLQLRFLFSNSEFNLCLMLCLSFTNYVFCCRSPLIFLRRICELEELYGKRTIEDFNRCRELRDVLLHLCFDDECQIAFFFAICCTLHILSLIRLCKLVWTHVLYNILLYYWALVQNILWSLGRPNKQWTINSRMLFRFFACLVFRSYFQPYNFRCIIFCIRVFFMLHIFITLCKWCHY